MSQFQLPLALDEDLMAYANSGGDVRLGIAIQAQMLRLATKQTPPASPASSSTPAAAPPSAAATTVVVPPAKT